MKKNILVVILLLGTSTLFAQGINWISMDEALAMQQKAPKKYLLICTPHGVVPVKCWTEIRLPIKTSLPM